MRMSALNVHKCEACGTTFATARCPGCSLAPAGVWKLAAGVRSHVEDDEQMALIEWRDTFAPVMPGLELLHAVPNGGKRDPREAKRLKAMGVVAGAPDLDLPLARGGYFGLRIELKPPMSRLGTGRRPTTSPKQERWIARLNAEGYRAVVCFGWDDARKIITAYMKLPRTVAA